MSYATKLKATLPKEIGANGLHVIRRDLLNAPATPQVLIVVVDCHRIIDDLDDMIRTPVARILRIEPETDADRAAALLARATDLADARIQKPPPLLDANEATGLRNATGLRLAGGTGSIR